MTAGNWSALARRFGLGAVRGTPSYVARGAMGEIWRLDTDRGSWAVKWQFPWAPAQRRPADLQVQAAAAAAGIPLPAPVTTPAGDAVASIDGRFARVYEWVSLAPPVRPPAASATAAEAGRLLGVLHALALPAREAVAAWYTQAPAPRDWAVLTRLARAAGMAWADKLAAADALIAALTARIAPPPAQAAIVCHRDFHPENVFPRGHGQFPRGHDQPAVAQLVVLDWENSGPMYPDRELGYVLHAWATGRRQVSLPAARALLSGYAQACGRVPALQEGLFSTTIATQLNFLLTMGRQALNDPAHRAYAELQIDAVLTHDLQDTRDILDLELAALRG